MESLFTFCVENSSALFAALLAAHGLAVAVVNLTPTPKDDEFVAKAYKVIEFLAGIFGKTAKK